VFTVHASGFDLPVVRIFGSHQQVWKERVGYFQIIKEESAANFEKAVEKIDDGAEIPVMSQFYMRLHAIDFELTREFFPINEAIKRAIEIILHYHAYRS